VVGVRTTITLTPDAEQLVKRAMRERGESLKTVVNAAIVAALAAGGREPVELPAFDMGQPLADLDHSGRLLADLEMADFTAAEGNARVDS
jgi:hypothetical protein